MKYGLMPGAFGPDVNIDIEEILEAEKLGFDSVWSAEAWGNDALTPLAWIAAQTTKIKLGTAIMQMPARTPAMCAMSAMTLDQLSGGRMIVGLGPSGPQVIEGWHGVPYGKPLTRTREYITIMKKIFARDAPVSFEGEIYQMPYTGEGASGMGKPLKSILHGRKDIPIFTATISPKGVETAGQVADGFIPVWTSPDGLKTFEENVEAGFAKAGDGKGWEGFHMSPWVNVAMGDDLEACRNQIRPHLGFYIGGMGSRKKNFYKNHVSRQGWPEAAQKIQDLFLDKKRGEAFAAVPDDLIDAVALVGSKERIADRLAEWQETKASTILLSASREAQRVIAEILG